MGKFFITDESNNRWVSKKCRKNLDCYAESARLLAEGKCDPGKPGSKCVYCCEGDMCNYEDEIENSFYIFLKLAATGGPRLKSANVMVRNNLKDKRWLEEMYDSFR